MFLNNYKMLIIAHKILWNLIPHRVHFQRWVASLSSAETLLGFPALLWMKPYPALKEVRTASLISLSLAGSAVFTLITLTMGAGAANATASLCMCVIITTQSRLGRETCMHQAQQNTTLLLSQRRDAAQKSLFSPGWIQQSALRSHTIKCILARGGSKYLQHLAALCRNFVPTVDALPEQQRPETTFLFCLPSVKMMASNSYPYVEVES